MVTIHIYEIAIHDIAVIFKLLALIQDILCVVNMIKVQYSVQVLLCIVQNLCRENAIQIDLNLIALSYLCQCYTAGRFFKESQLQSFSFEE